MRYEISKCRVFLRAEVCLAIANLENLGGDLYFTPQARPAEVEEMDIFGHLEIALMKQQILWI